MKHSIVIHNGTVITMNSDFDIINNGVLCIKNDKLVKIESLENDSLLPEAEKTIDARGQLPDGTQFEGSEQLKNVLISQRMPNLTRQITEKMLTYALGRQLEYYDEQTIRTIVKETTENDYRFQTLIKSIINSQPFLYRQLPGDSPDE